MVAAGLGENFTPWIYDGGMSAHQEVISGLSNTVSCTDKNLIFDGSSSQQGIPMHQPACWPGSWDKENGNILKGQLADQLWKPYVIAYYSGAFYTIQHKGREVSACGKILVLPGRREEMGFPV